MLNVRRSTSFSCLARHFHNTATASATTQAWQGRKTRTRTLCNTGPYSKLNRLRSTLGTRHSITASYVDFLNACWDCGSPPWYQATFQRDFIFCTSSLDSTLIADLHLTFYLHRPFRAYLISCSRLCSPYSMLTPIHTRL